MISRRACAKRHLEEPLSVKELAEVAHLSPRQFSRVFHTEADPSPAKAIENLRLEAAGLESSRAATRSTRWRS